ncbi:MAG: rod shape-determining protein RodA [Mariniphaga sp.]|nr:rod shape-determining protein RodA [Mariniphaga sp.]
MARRNSILANLDWITIVIYFALIFLGWINIYAAVFNEQFESIFDISQRYGKQLIWIIAAVIIAFVTLVLEARFYVFFAYPIYGLFVLLLLIVLFIGEEIHGAKSWFVIAGFNIQPSEFAKFATSLGLAKIISSYNFKMHKPRPMLIISALIGIPAILIYLQNDTGSALVYMAFILVLYREGLSGVILFFALLAILLFVLSLILNTFIIFLILLISSLLVFYFMNQRIKEFGIVISVISISALIFWLLKTILMPEFENALIIMAGGVFGIFLLFFRAIIKRLKKYIVLFLVFIGALTFTLSVDYVFENILEPHQQARINELLGIESDPLGAGYNVNQSKIAIGSGGFAGKGFLKGTQTKFDFVPEQSTDFIFCTVGEEWGFIGTTVVIILFLILLARILILAERQRSVFSRVYGYSVASILFMHFIINIGMTIGLMPVIGIPLPFFSYGGSSLWSFTILLSIFLRLDASRLELIY